MYCCVFFLQKKYKATGARKTNETKKITTAFDHFQRTLYWVILL